MTDKDIVLREFKYFDRQIVIDFLSSIEGGLATMSKASLIKKSGKLGGKAGIPSILEVGGERGLNEITIEESKTVGDAALFQRLYTALVGQKMIEKVEAMREEFFSNIKQGSVLEIHGRVELPIFEIALDIFDQFFPVMQQFPTQGMDQKGLVAFNMLKGMLSLGALNVRIVPIQESKVNLVATLNRQKLKVTKQELLDVCFALCRVRNILKKDETFDMLKLPIKMTDKIIEHFRQSFANMPSNVLDVLGKEPTLEDFQIHSPAVILSPIAIYQ